MAQRPRQRRVEEETFGETLTPAVAPVGPRYYRDSYFGLANFVYAILGILEAILLLRLLFLLFGANPNNGFVNFVYAVSHPFVAPFSGIFGNVFSTGSNVIAIFEPATVVAMIVYAVIGWAIVRLIAAATAHPAE